MANDKSERQKVAERIASFAGDLEYDDGRHVFGGPIPADYMGYGETENGGKYHSIVLMKPATLDAEIRVYSTDYITYDDQGPAAVGYRKFDSEREVKDFLEGEHS